MNYYSILDLNNNASTEEIKKAFRKKLKKHHPDISSSSSTTKELQKENLINIINAYGVLSNPIKRKHYDAGVGVIETGVFDESTIFRKKKKPFDYKQFLLSRQDQWEYKVKLFIYDLVFSSGNYAIRLYEQFVFRKEIPALKKELGFFDYFDCIFLLAEKFQKSNNPENLYKAFLLYYEIILLEESRPYFKSYMEEVTERILTIISQNEAFEEKFILLMKEKVMRFTITPKQKKKIISISEERRVYENNE